jgi:hypothetical protein
LIESWSSPTSVLFLAAAIYLYLSFLGWGLTRIALPQTLSQYRAWFAPWIGIMLAAVLGVRLSRLGMGATVAVYSITVVGAGVGILSALRKLRSLPMRRVPRTAFIFGFLATLLLALYPRHALAAVSQHGRWKDSYRTVPCFHPPFNLARNPLQRALDRRSHEPA